MQVNLANSHPWALGGARLLQQPALQQLPARGRLPPPLPLPPAATTSTSNSTGGGSFSSSAHGTRFAATHQRAELQSRAISISAERCPAHTGAAKVYYNVPMLVANTVAKLVVAPDEPTMVAFYDSSLPIAYATMRQHARRSKHATLLAHHSDIMSQVRVETSARAPAPNAFVAVGPTPGDPGPSPGGPAVGGGDGGKCHSGRSSETRLAPGTTPTLSGPPSTRERRATT